MKKIYLLFLLFINVSIGQELAIQDYNYSVSDSVNGAVKNLSEEKIYIVDFGDNNQKMIEKSSFFMFEHPYQKEGSYVITLYDLSDGKKAVSAKQVTIAKEKKTLRISKITFLDYNPIKDTGAAWDLATGGTYPDVYMKFYNPTTGKSLGHTQDRTRQNVKAKSPISWSFESFSLNKETLKDGFEIQFLDYDSISGDDTIGGIAFKNALATFKDQSGTITIDDIEKYNCAFSIEYSWE
ncbi:hypothetical protein SAMN05216480_12355 [Pustulibacterium marinum]|uniref:PKD domain-containing protein n=1 Tax=Pustulibacterium marinum TaxID=1224947 RepID=A0A1I7IWX1_9FLAO|nr:hypothetical protein [Pustulibacterium marinum]SFU77408.1 hypothetical protein SAMN05216480_12355 [Pustulibacterium marinum]